ncbi:MAG: DUF2513 domain-containing protein [Clostridiales bacterium]|nr:DUF2513 domain-containing protein [Clostridiales bacterium]MDY4172656.1 DUF2513 domain-containing protein [Evtepia sp.]
MKLEPDCVRAILLTVEENTSYQSLLSFEEATLPDFPRLTEYPLDEVLYHLKKCNEAGLLCGAQFFYDSANVEGLHFRGHEFLENIRDDSRWHSVKKGLEAIRNYSLPAIASIAESVAATAISGFISG